MLFRSARKAGYAYVIVKYTERGISTTDLWNKISKAIADINTEEIKEIKPAKPKAKIQSKGFQKPQKDYQWPTKKIQSRKFQKKQ